MWYTHETVNPLDLCGKKRESFGRKDWGQVQYLCNSNEWLRLIVAKSNIQSQPLVQKS